MMYERERSEIHKTRKSRVLSRLGTRLGFAVWAMAAAVWFIEAGEEVIPIGHGSTPAVASDDNDDSIVAWQNSDSEVVVQSLRMGVTVGIPIRISAVDEAQRSAAAAHLVDNEFVVAWEEAGDAGTGIMARRVQVLNAPVPGMGVTVGIPIRITEVGSSPAVDADEDGNFVVAWTAPDPVPHAQGAHRHFVIRSSRMGVTVGIPIRLGARSGATPPDVARRPDGDSLVVWEDAFKNISGAIVDASGDVVKDRIRINHLRLGRQSSPAVTVPLDGNFTVVWERRIFNHRFVVGRRIGVDGHGIGGEFLVSLSSSTVATEPDVASDPWGRSFATWTSRPWHTGDRLILGRPLDLDGGGGDEFLLASPNAVVSSVDRASGAEDFVVVWESEDDDALTAGNVIASRFVLVPY